LEFREMRDQLRTAERSPTTSGGKSRRLEEEVELAKSEHALKAPEQNAAPEDSDTTLRLQEMSTLPIREDNDGSRYDRVLDAAINLMSADMGSMQIFDPDRGELRLLAERGLHPESAAFWEWIRVDSATTCGMALSSGRRIVVPDIDDCHAIAGTPDHKAYHRSHVRAVQSTPLVARSGLLLGMISTYWRRPHWPTEREFEPLDMLARQAADLFERNEADQALRESRTQFQWLASIVESSNDAIVSQDIDGIITSWNKGAERIFGYLAEEVIGKSMTGLIPPEHLHEEKLILSRIRHGDGVDNFETIGRRKDGNLIDISLTVSPVRNANGKVVGASRIARDITERKRSEAQIAVLAREAEHRAKNLLANFRAIVHLSQADTLDGLKQAIKGRIEALANVQSLFAQSRWTGAELGHLIRQELSPYSRDGEKRMHIHGPKVMLEPDVAQTIAVALHELATNAAKYGALSVAAGHIRVEWHRAADGRLVLRWTEAGGPPVNPPTRKGFGTRVIETMVRSHDGADAQMDWRAEGLACEIALPVSPDQAGRKQFARRSP
jgi:PAS domain S-box-containing protein